MLENQFLPTQKTFHPIKTVFKPPRPLAIPSRFCYYLKLMSTLELCRAFVRRNKGALEMRKQRPPFFWIPFISAFGVTLFFAVILSFPIKGYPKETAASVVLEDFSNVDSNNLPVGWTAQREKPAPSEVYKVQREGGRIFLSADGRPNRLFKKVKWNPNKYPFLTWKWRMRNVPTDPDKERNAAVYVALGTDVFGIPKITKYLWSSIAKPGEEISGGIFRPTSIVLRSGRSKSGEWVTETINVLEDHRRLHNETPPDEAYGIGIATSIEADFSEFVAHQ